MRPVHLILLALACAAALAPAPAAAAVGDFRGFVTNAENGTPVSGAVVTAGERIAVSGADGAYRLPIAMAGRYVVRVESAPYHPAEKTAPIDSGRIDLNFELSPRLAEARVFGTVYDAALMRPVAKAEVSLDGVALRTGPDGQFVFDPVEAGDRWLSVAAVGYKVSAKRLRIDARHEQVDVHLTPDVEFAKIEGVCLDRATSRPIPLAVVRLGDDRAATDADGRFALPARVPGEARLLVTRDGYYKQQIAIDTKPGRTNLVIHLEARDAAEILDLMRRNVRDRSRIEAVTEGPAADGARSLDVSTRTLPLADRRREIERILGADVATPTENFVRGEIRLGPDGEYAGFIAFLYDGVRKTTRNVSLRAAANSRDVLLTRATYRFRPTDGGVVVTLAVDGWSGTALLRESGRVAGFTVLLDPPAGRLAGPVDALSLGRAASPAVPAKPGLEIPDPAPLPGPIAPPDRPPIEEPKSEMMDAPKAERPAHASFEAPTPAAAAETAPGARELEVGVAGWSGGESGTIAAKGMNLAISDHTGAGATNAFSADASLRLTDRDRLALGYATLEHKGTLASGVTFDGLAYAAGAALETGTTLLDAGLSRFLLRDARGFCRLDSGMIFSRTTMNLAQALRAGALVAEFSAPYLGIAGRSRLSKHVVLESAVKGSSRRSDDGLTQLTDATLAFLFGNACADGPDDSEWYGSLGYRFFMLLGTRNAESIDLKYSGPTFGLKSRL